MRDPKRSAAFDEGYEACHHGAFIFECPYERGELRDEWREGFESYEDMAWREAQRNDYDEVLDDPRHGQAEEINRGR